MIIGRSVCHPANVGCSFFWYRNDTPTRDVNTKHGLRKTTELHNTSILGATLRKEEIRKE